MHAGLTVQRMSVLPSNVQALQVIATNFAKNMTWYARFTHLVWKLFHIATVQLSSVMPFQHALLYAFQSTTPTKVLQPTA